MKDGELVSGWVQEILLKEKIVGNLDSITLLVFYKLDLNTSSPVDIAWISSVTGLTKSRAKIHIKTLISRGYLKNIFPANDLYVFRLGPVFREILIKNVEALFDYTFEELPKKKKSKSPEEKFLDTP